MRFWGGLLGPCSFVSARAVMKPNNARAAKHSWHCTRHSPRAGVCWPLRGAARMCCCCMCCSGACGRLTYAASKPAIFLPLQYGWTPLHGAAFRGNTAAAEILLKHGAQVNALDEARGVCGFGAGFWARARL